MQKRRWMSLVLTISMLATLFAGITMVSATGQEEVELSSMVYKTFNFKSTEAGGAINVKADDLYSADKGYGFIATNNAMPKRTVDPTRIAQDENGCFITETAETTNHVNNNNFNYGGLIFRVDLDAIGGYNIDVTLADGSTSANTAVAPNGMKASELTRTSTWDQGGLVNRNNYATFNGSNWSYDYVTGVPYIELEVEPSERPAAGTKVGIESLALSKLDSKLAGEKPTIFVLGDSTQKSYIFQEFSMSGYGQIINQMFDLDKVNVINYSMGGRSMKSNHDEGRFNDVLYTSKPGDFVLLHSAHNDESTGNETGPEARFGRGSNKDTYPVWLDMYCEVLKSQGVTPVLATGMPRVNGVTGKYSENTDKPNGFSPDSPKFMRDKANADSNVELVELYNNAKAYIDKIGGKETSYIYMSIEAGETPGKTNSGSNANGHADEKIDGTHFKEAAAKMWSKIIASDIYKNGITNAGSASDKMKELAGYLRSDVKTACASGDWSAVYPENAKDVSEAKVNGYPETNAYYRNQIEKMLQLGAMQTDANGLFNPEEAISTNDFIAAICTIWNLNTSDFEKYFNSSKLCRETMAAIVLEAYELRFGKDASSQWNKPVYMSYTGGKEEAVYSPIVGWGEIDDLNDISKEHLGAFYEVYNNLGLIRSEKGIARGEIKNGTELEPKAEVTRAKAAKELCFLFALQHNDKSETHITTIPTNYGGTDKNPVVYKPVSYSPMTYEFSRVNIDRNNKLSVDLKYNGASEIGSNLLVIVKKDATGSEISTERISVLGSGLVSGIDITLETGESVSMHIEVSDLDDTWLSKERTAVSTDAIIPQKVYTVSNVAGIQNGTIALTNLDEAETVSLSGEVELSASPVWWKANGAVAAGKELMPDLVEDGGSLTPMIDLATTSGTSATIEGEKFTNYVTHASENGKFEIENGMITGCALKFVAPKDGVLSVYYIDVGENKELMVCEEGTTAKTEALYYYVAPAKSNLCASVSVEAGKTYYAGVLGSKGRAVGVSFIGGAPVVKVKAKNGDTVQIDATPENGYTTKSISAVDKDGNKITLTMNDADQATFVMPESDVTIDAAFESGSDPTTPPDPTNPPVPTSTPEVEEYDYEIKQAYFGDDGKLNVELEYNGKDASPTAKLLVGEYDEADEEIMQNSAIFDINGTAIDGLDYMKPDSGTVRLYIWNGVDTLNPLSGAKAVGDTPPPTATPTSTPAPPTETPAPATATPTTGPTTNPERVITVDLNQESNPDNKVYKTVSEAVAAAVAINPKSESERIYINLEPGIYTEQIYLENVSYLTFQKRPGAEGTAEMRWHYCTGYTYSDCGPNGYYDPKIDWSDPRTWNGYKEGDEQFTAYEIGKPVSGKISYYETDGTIRKDVSVYQNKLGKPQALAPLHTTNSTDWIEVNDIYLSNSINICVTQAEKDSHITPESGLDADWTPPVRINLPICEEETPEIAVDPEKYNPDKTDYTPGQSAYLVRSRVFNERGHAFSTHSKHMKVTNCKIRSNQDAIYVGDNGSLVYFKDCDLIGGTDYIYGDANALFDNCKLGMAGYSETHLGQVITAASTKVDNPYGYLFYNCSIYYNRANSKEKNSVTEFGRPWGGVAQVTFYNTDVTGVTINPEGWRDMSIKKDEARFYEYGTTSGGKPADTSKRVKNAVAPFGTVLNEWQILEFNPRNYMPGWDPMNFGEYLTEVDVALAGTSIIVPSNEETTFDLPLAPSGITFNWESNSTNAIVSEDGTKLKVVRPAVGESSIQSSVILYARNNNNGFGDRKVIPVTITPTTNTEDVYTVSGDVTLSTDSDVDVTVTIKYMSEGALIKQTNVVVPKGQKTISYSSINLPVGTYDVTMSVDNDLYNMAIEATTISGAKSETKTLDIQVKKMQEIKVISPDFSAQGYTPTINNGTDFSGGIYTVTGEETANLGDGGNKVLKLTKEAGSVAQKGIGASFDIISMLPEGSSLQNTKTIQFSFDFLMEKGGNVDDSYMPKMYNGFDLATSKANGGTYAADQTRFLRWSIYKGWDQFNTFTATNERVNGNNTQFTINNKMENKWYRIVGDIDLVNQVITTTYYDRDWKTGDPGTYMLNSKPFTIAAPDVDGNNKEYPTQIDLNNLYFNIYMDVRNETTTKMEMFFDNIEMVYQDFE